jgi:hypothetical protein
MESSYDYPAFYLRKESEDEWRQIVAVYSVPSDAVGAASIRLRIWPQFTGIVYFDDVEFAPLSDEDLMADIGTFSTGKPHFWNAESGNSGATLTWATDEAHAPPYSLKIEKPSTGSEGARWISDGQVRYWNPKVPEGEDIKVGVYVKTEGVNTDPQNEDEKWQMKIWFYDADGGLIGDQPFVLDIDQSVASRDWYENTNEEGTLILPEEAEEWYISVEAGPNATGTVWFDTFIFHGREAWAGGPWNQFVNADEGWFYWIHEWAPYMPAITAGVTTEEARTGDYSLKVEAPEGRSTGELVWISETVEIPKGSEGKLYVLSAWVKTEGVEPDSIFNDAYAVGFTATWHPMMFDDMKGLGWEMESSYDYPAFYLRKESEDEWRQIVAVYSVPSDAIGAVSIRLRIWPQFTGTVYWDNVEFREVEAIAVSVDDGRRGLVSDLIPTDYRLFQNYPNPFNPVTTIEYRLPEAASVTLEVYNMLGQRVKTLVDDHQQAGVWRVVWDATDDIGRTVSSGMYIYRLRTENATMTQKMLLLK